MIEIVFNESACASLKIAQNYGRDENGGCSIGVIVSHSDGRKPTKKEIKQAKREAEEQERLARESAIPLGGSPADVYGFDLSLSMGNISESEPGALRLRELEHLYSIYPHEEGLQAAHEMLQTAKDNLKTVCDRVSAGEDIRIWYSSQPDELCGLYWLMARLDRLEECRGQISMIKLPEWETGDKGTILRIFSCGEVMPGAWHRYLSLQSPIPAAFRQDCAAHWLALQKEGAPLRAVLNGRLVGVPETFYDDFIIREIAAESETFQEGMIVGRVLGKYRLGISDAWIALRMEEMIYAGKLEAVTEPAADMPVYHRVLKKGTGFPAY